ncbi:2-dehydropantoate 2-reductase [Peribacillus sp. SCS-37]|uniref:2-dehydropantoate 2-reductase n=1 Tax=Paraperibacillus esterisolvens TaxID=3115296 RepID=UPI003905A2AF
MEINIIGGGAVGLLTAACLSRGNNLTLYTRTAGQAETINKNGINLERGGTVEKMAVTACPVSEMKNEGHITIVCVKAHHLEYLLPLLPETATPVLFLQNGMGHLSLLADLPVSQIAVGIVEHGAQKKNDFTVSHTGAGNIRAAVYRGSLDSFKIKSEDALFPFIYEKDYYKMMLKKLIVNACVNPLTAVLGARNGELLDNPHFNSLFQSMYKEAAAVFTISDSDGIKQYIEEVCRNTEENKSSMLVDLENGRKTEIDAILGYILQEAERKKIEPALTRLLYTMIKGKERL